MSKHNRRPIPDIPAPKPASSVQQEVKLEKVEQKMVVSEVAPLSDRVAQDRYINAMDVAGHVYYESLKVEQANIVSRVAPLSDRVAQDRVINAMDSAGYVHYESLPIGGNEIILRFRKK